MCHRVRASGGTIVYDPAASLIHLRVPMGGCRDEADELKEDEARVFNDHYYVNKIGQSSLGLISFWNIMRARLLNRKTLSTLPASSLALRSLWLLQAWWRAQGRTRKLMRVGNAGRAGRGEGDLSEWPPYTTADAIPSAAGTARARRVGPTVSVLIPCHNAAPYISAALDSVLTQTWRPLEVIVVDDGSTDDSPAVLERYASRGVWVIRQASASGAAAARNRALGAASGQLILFLDADDLINVDHISSLHAAIAGAPGCIAMSQWDRFSVSPDETRFPHRPSYRDAPGAAWLAQDWADGGAMAQCGMFLIPRVVLEFCGRLGRAPLTPSTISSSIRV